MAENNPPLQYNASEKQMDVINAPKDEKGNILYTVLTNLDVRTKFILQGWDVKIVGVN